MHLIIVNILAFFHQHQSTKIASHFGAFLEDGQVSAAPDILFFKVLQAATFHTFYTHIIISYKLYSFRL